jgi:hypothetical protein
MDILTQTVAVVNANRRPVDADGVSYESNPFTASLDDEPRTSPGPDLRIWLAAQVEKCLDTEDDANSLWLAGKLRFLLKQAQALDAATPDDFEDRYAAVLEARGYAL